MVFIRDLVASLSQPVRRLRSFTRSTLGPGQSATLTFELGWKDLGFWDNQDHYAVEAGSFEVHVGGGLDHTQLVELRVS
ncbi:fibronectin type III-like domain-contianing protein [Arthrobacter sp. TS-15]|uniref:fibronectin type III-like domain-contianing protein n=2 Tax=unclassified Arthrobacter TaxID=235627 RepID=UPI00237BE1B7|nr:fibronectin type III-like domain-contianing protein [Arthrobacter sp. TS-15]